MRLAGVGAFRVAPSGDVLAIPAPDAPFSLVQDAYRRTVLPQALQFFGQEVIHASAVVANGMVYINSGYVSLIGRPGNVLLAFGVD